ncbi:FecR domain-containing protein [Flammeovirgaceae bacterium SG7u.111]|nr:FecR domain-containing protein [Flammeovirgaceae bacterium SG7u.132]WPO33521.1 FecR domain-containing protein [Flammeovirgaceae bacterium SG7u.111]
MENDQYWTLIAHYLSEEAGEETSSHISRLKKEHPEFEKQLREASMIWNSSKKHNLEPTFSDSEIDAAIEKMSGRLGSDAVEDQATTTHVQLSFKKKRLVFRAAAAVALLMVSVFSLVYVLQSASTPGLEAVALKGETKNIVLPDGTKVLLAPDSKLSYPETFGSVREVNLEGLAYFDVTKNPDKPFVIETAHSLTKVLGTSFAIEAYPEAENETIAVTSGKVSFGDLDGDNTLLLTKDEAAVLSVKNGRVAQMDNLHNELIAWTDSTFAFRKTKVSKVFKTFERYYDVSFVIRDKAILDFSFSADVKDKSLEEALQQMQGVFNFTYKINGKQVTIDQPSK